MSQKTVMCLVYGFYLCVCRRPCAICARRCGSRWACLVSRGLMAMDRGISASQLCEHGVDCPRWRRGACPFAHGLQELRAPDESRGRMPGLWRGGVDRWFGQCMSSRQMARIRRYWNSSPSWERPAWAHGLEWLANNRPATAYPELPWDFNLSADWDFVCRVRGGRVPFRWSCRRDGLGIWRALTAR